MDTARSYAFPRTATVRGRGVFTRIMDERVREARGPLVLHAAPNGIAQSRLGISIGRKVGNAVVRNRVKRLLRESFRLARHDWPRGYDVVIIVRPHEPLILAEYQKLIAAMVLKVHKRWEARDMTNEKTRNDEPMTKSE